MNTKVRWREVETPMGRMRVCWSDRGVVAIHLGGQLRTPVPPEWEHAPGAPHAVIDQLREYFDRRRHTFDVPLDPRGTEFQRRVWQELSRIPYGTTRTYAEIARSIGRPTAARAVGAANSRNPISIVVPCHRVIGASGALTGYAGGLEHKARLLALEGVAPSASPKAG